MEQILKQIQKIEVIEAYHLQHSDVLYQDCVLLNVPQIFEEIPKIGLASCAVSEKIENNQSIFTTKLVYLCKKTPRNENKDLAYRITTVDGEQLLIGLDEPPYPTATRTQNFPKAATGNSAEEVTIQWISPYPPLSIVG